MDLLSLGRPSINSSDPYLSIQVEPLSSAFYAGETFQVRITFTNTRPPPVKSTQWTGKQASRLRGHRPGFSVDATGGMPTSPKTAAPAMQSSSSWTQENAEAGPSVPRRQGVVGSSKSVHKGRSPSMGKHASRSPKGREWQQKVDGQNGLSGKDWSRLRLEQSRSRSVDLEDGTMSPQEIVWGLEAAQGSYPQRPHQGTLSPIGSQSSLNSRPATPEPQTPITGQSLVDRAFRDHEAVRMSRVASGSREVLSPGESSRSSSDGGLSVPKLVSPRRPNGIRNQPSYLNGYGADTLGIDLPPPIPEDHRTTPPSLLEPGSTTILWAHTRLMGYFIPSSTYIPPDPLLPLRSLLLHQPLGSGSLIGADQPVNSSRWSISFGSGTIGKESAPSLTGSLFGLAKGIVWGGNAGTLEEERRKIWATKNLPVLESVKSLIGVDIQLAAGETKSFIYTLPLPEHLPPTFRGSALRFGYDVCVSVNVALPGPGKKQRTKEISVPIRVWPHTALKQTARMYDVLQPIMQRTDEGQVEPDTTKAHPEQTTPTSTENHQTLEALREYARSLQVKPATDPIVETSDRLSLLKVDGAAPGEVDTTALSVPGVRGSLKRMESVEDVSVVGRGCREAVDIMSRISQKVSFDIRKDGSDVATLTLVKGVYRVGESILGVVDLNAPSNRRVAKFTAQLISEESIPELLLPHAEPGQPPNEPHLTRIFSEANQAVTIQTSRLSFSLDIPSDATPGFGVMAANDGHPGGLEWKVKLSFLVLQPKGHTRQPSGSAPANQHPDGPGVPTAEEDLDNEYIIAPGHLTSSRLNSDLLSNRPGQAAQLHRSGADMVECVVPVRVIAGNTSFLVRPAVFVV